MWDGEDRSVHHAVRLRSHSGRVAQHDIDHKDGVHYIHTVGNLRPEKGT